MTGQQQRSDGRQRYEHGGEEAWLTPDEARAVGFCPNCKQYIADNSQHDWSMAETGYCADCRVALFGNPND